jgi:hypothetical protein
MMSVTNNQCTVDNGQEVIHGLVVGFGLSTVIEALRNDCCSFECLDDAGYSTIYDKHGDKLGSGLEKALRASRKIADKNGMVV